MHQRSLALLAAAALALAGPSVFAQEAASAKAAEPKPAADKAVSADTQKLPPIQTVEFVPAEGFKVNGEPFFPILLYGPQTAPEELADFKSKGFNVLGTSREGQAQAAWDAGFYNAQYKGRKKIAGPAESVFIGIGMDSPVLYFKKDLIAQSKEDLAKAQAELPNRPIFHAIGYWLDEPEGVIAGTLPPKEKYEDLIRVIDVSAPYLYPVPHQPTTTVGDAVARARAATAGQKAVLPVLQLFTWKVEDRYPTHAELREMVWHSIAAGADGVGYYCYNYVTGKKGTTIAKEQPELWECTGQINHHVKWFAGKIAGLKEIKTGVTIKDEAGNANPAHVVAREWKSDAGRRVVLIVNATDKPATAQVPGAAGAKTHAVGFDGPGKVGPLSDSVPGNIPAKSMAVILWEPTR